MSAFKKFDPQAFLECERLASGSTETLAALATLAGPPLKNEIRGTASEIVSQRNTGAVVKSIEAQRDDDTFIDRLDQLGKNQNWTATPAKAAKVAKDQNFSNFSSLPAALDALERKCPDFVPDDRWRQAVEDGRQFLAAWGDQAQAFGWTARELFGLHPVPEQPAPSYRRLSRYDETGLIWLLRSRPVVALTETTAAIQGATAVLTYRKINKPALGPVADSLDDWGAPWSRTPATFKQRDVKAAIKAAVDAGLSVARIEVDREGRIIIIAHGWKKMRVRLKGLNSKRKRLADGGFKTYWWAWKGGPARNFDIGK